MYWLVITGVTGEPELFGSQRKGCPETREGVSGKIWRSLEGKHDTRRTKGRRRVLSLVDPLFLTRTKYGPWTGYIGRCSCPRPCLYRLLYTVLGQEIVPFHDSRRPLRRSLSTVRFEGWGSGRGSLRSRVALRRYYPLHRGSGLSARGQCLPSSDGRKLFGRLRGLTMCVACFYFWVVVVVILVFVPETLGCKLTKDPCRQSQIPY